MTLADDLRDYILGRVYVVMEDFMLTRNLCRELHAWSLQCLTESFQHCCSKMQAILRWKRIRLGHCGCGYWCETRAIWRNV